MNAHSGLRGGGKATTEQRVAEAQALLAKWRAEADARYLQLGLSIAKDEQGKYLSEAARVATQLYVDGCIATYRSIKGML